MGKRGVCLLCIAYHSYNTHGNDGSLNTYHFIGLQGQ